MKKIIYMMAVALGIVSLSAVECHAGSINADEARLYSAASAGFTYEGESYYASGEYLAKLSSYLSRDDIDLTKAEVNSHIRSMNRKTNIKKAIDNGYIVKAGTNTPEPDTEGKDDTQKPDNPTETETTSGSTETETTDTEKRGSTENPSNTETPDTEKNTGNKEPDTQKEEPGTQTGEPATENGKKTPNKDDKKNNRKDDGNKGGNSGNTDQNGGDRNTEIGGTSDGGTSSGQTTTFDSAAQADEAEYSNAAKQQERKDILATRPDKEDASSGEITYDIENNQIIFSGSRNQRIIIPYAFRQIKGTHTRSTFTTIELVLLALTMISGGVLFAFRCLSFQKKQKKVSYSNHKRRRMLRKVFGGVLMLVLAVNICAVAAGTGLQVGLFQSGRITDMLSASGYYHESYDALAEDIHQLLEENDCPQNACDNVITYDRYLFATRNHVQMTLQGKTPSAEYTDISGQVAEALDGVVYLTDESKADIGDAVLKVYRQYVKNIIGESIYEIKRIFTNIFRINMFLAGINIILDILLLLFMDHYKHRGMKRIALSIGLAVVLVCVAAAVVLFGKPYTRLYIEPDYLYLFAVEYIRFMTRIFLIMAAVGAVAALAVGVAARRMKKSLYEK